MKKSFIRMLTNNSGQTMTEYALILAVIAVVVVGTITLLGDEIKAVFQSVIDAV
jgi:pilus assembly protein Flp/PilA